MARWRRWEAVKKLNGDGMPDGSIRTDAHHRGLIGEIGQWRAESGGAEHRTEAALVVSGHGWVSEQKQGPVGIAGRPVWEGGYGGWRGRGRPWGGVREAGWGSRLEDDRRVKGGCSMEADLGVEQRNAGGEGGEPGGNPVGWRGVLQGKEEDGRRRRKGREEKKRKKKEEEEERRRIREEEEKKRRRRGKGRRHAVGTVRGERKR